MTAWLAKHGTRALAVALLVAAACGLVAIRSCDSTRSAKAQAGLATEQGTAAIQSGQDAVQTIGNSQAREAETHTTVKEATDAIAQAPAGDSNDAADRAACSLRSYRNHPRCVALLGPAAK